MDQDKVCLGKKDRVACLRRRHSFYIRRDFNWDCSTDISRPSRREVFGTFERLKTENLHKDNLNLSKEKDEAVSSLKKIHRQQRELYDDFKLLRQKYDDLKSELKYVLWDVIPSLNHSSNFREIAVTNHAIFETNDQVGDYIIGSHLGEGQFADVKICTNTISNQDYAMKIISKTKTVSFVGLQRVQTEINILKQLQNPNIVKLIDVINTSKHVYIMTEIGGKDLFEFFDANPKGVANSVTRQIILGITLPLVYLHSVGICHRDIKPENILLRDQLSLDDITYRDVKICDFGQSAIIKNVKNNKFSDLCGSPGFFAPEMILDGNNSYDGFAADVWSLGCVMLELTRGHENFCKIWMMTYDYDNLQNEERFSRALKNAVVHLSTYNKTHLCPVQSGFLERILVLDPAMRIQTEELLHHPWFSQCELPTQIDDASNRIENNKEFIRHKYSSHVSRGGKSPRNDPKKKRTLFRDSLSSRARKYFAGADDSGMKILLSGSAQKMRENETNQQTPTKSNVHIEIRLPPIEPVTPSYKVAKQNVLESDRLVSYY